MGRTELAAHLIGGKLRPRQARESSEVARGSTGKGGPTCEPYINHCSAQHSEHVWLAPSEPPVPAPPTETAAAPAGPGSWCRGGERRAHSHSQSCYPSTHPPAHGVSMVGTHLYTGAHPAWHCCTRHPHGLLHTYHHHPPP